MAEVIDDDGMAAIRTFVHSRGGKKKYKWSTIRADLNNLNLYFDYLAFSKRVRRATAKDCQGCIKKWMKHVRKGEKQDKIAKKIEEQGE